MKKYFLGVLILSGNIVFFACNNQNKNSFEESQVADENTLQGTDTLIGMNTVNESDAKFMVEMAGLFMVDVEVGNLATQRSIQNPVRNMSGQILKDHTSALDELKILASLKNVTLPLSLNNQHQSWLEELQNIPETEFGKKYLSIIIDTHEESVKKFEKAANNLKSPEVKMFASRSLVFLRNHLDSARILKEKM
ncbi:MAG: DUF4142 domain-containing protein [Chitinophagaceae bacterium]|jgi:putative membrane protein|nr:DUF4142 domain-containing protein [Chitinophagaceae bacterium]